MKMKATEDRMRALGLLTPMSVLTLDEWEIPRDRVVINRKLGQGAFGTVCGGEAFFDEKGWVSQEVKGFQKIPLLSSKWGPPKMSSTNFSSFLVCTTNFSYIFLFIIIQKWKIVHIFHILVRLESLMERSVFERYSHENWPARLKLHTDRQSHRCKNYC